MSQNADARPENFQEYHEINAKNHWNVLYQTIKLNAQESQYPISAAKLLENRQLNRYRDVNPYDHSRVKLQRGAVDYINASLVKVPDVSRCYILTQGPLQNTVGHFWLMVWEQNSKAIVMLNSLVENKITKCHHYWPVGPPNSTENEIILKDVGLKVYLLSEMEEYFYTLRIFLIVDELTGNTKETLHYQYTSWPDFGVPSSTTEFIEFLFQVRSSGAFDSIFGPPIIHCSAGIGRSGAFVLVDSCLAFIEKTRDTNSIRICQRLVELRYYRMGLIQTQDQLKFSYLSIVKGAEIILKKLKESNPETGKNDSVAVNNSTMSEKATLIRRTRLEREKKVAALVKSMKKKQTDLEKQKAYPFLIHMSLGFGFVLSLAGIGYWLYKN